MGEFTYRRDAKLFVRCGLLAIMTIASLYAPQINVLTLVLAIYYTFHLNDEDTLCLFFFMVSFAPIFKFQLGGFCLLNILVFVAVGKKLLRNGAKLRGRASVSFLILVVYTFLSCILYKPTDWLSFVAYIAFAFFWYRPMEFNPNFRKIVTFFVLGIIITSTLALFAGLFPRLQSIMSETTIKLGVDNYYYRFSGLDPNPNYYTMSLSVCIAAITVMIHSNKARIIDFIYLICLTVFGLMSVSQSFLVCYIVTWILFVVFGGAKRAKRFLAVILLLLIVFASAVIILNEETLQTLLFRFDAIIDSDSVSSATSGRTGLWTEYLSYLLNNPVLLLLGRGIGAPNLPSGASHNYYIDVVYHLGIIGGAIYLSFFCALLGKRRHLGKVELFRYVPYFAFFIRALARNLILSEQLVFLLMVCSLAVYDNYSSRIG